MSLSCSPQGPVAKPAAVPVLAFDEIDSTNAEARRRGEAGEAGPLWLTSRRQTAGRGRRGRGWETGPGNLAATLLTTTTKPPIEAAQVAFVAALAVADLALAHVPAALVRVKWPNDVLVDGRKVAGVLVESGPSSAGGLWLAIGMGVNLQTPPAAAERPVAALGQHLRADLVRPMTPPEALARLAADVAAWMARWEAQGFAPIAQAWTALAYGLGEACSARLPNETVRGVALGLDADGALRLRLADGGVRRITAGDVFFGEGG